MATTLNISELSTIVSPGSHIFLPGAIGTPEVFIDELLKNSDNSKDIEILTSIAPGVDCPLNLSKLDSSAITSGLFMQPAFSQAQRNGQYRALPMSYSMFAHYLKNDVKLDLTVVQVSEPNELGLCSLGPTVEFSPIAINNSRCVLALINPKIPYLPTSICLPFESFDYICSAETELVEYKVKTDDSTETIAKHIASMIGDGSTLQTGFGKVPTALSNLLSNHSNLRLHSGLLSDGLMVLAKNNALDTNFVHTACALAGSSEFYNWLPQFDNLRVRDCLTTHDSSTLASLDKFISVNSALEVDLFGQCNLENAGGRAVSGAGGASDFARAARASSDGLSIVALNASYKRGTKSRIVPTLSQPGIASLGRADVDVIITEFGIADLRGASVHERAKAIVNISDPNLQEQLEKNWHAISTSL